MKLLHIISDIKFIDLIIEKYVVTAYYNEFIYLKNHAIYGGKYPQMVLEVEPFSEDFYNLKDALIKFDIVFFYNLDSVKAYLVNKFLADTNAILIWNFFGTEIYSNVKYSFHKQNFSAKTKELLQPREVWEKFKRILRFLKYSLKGRLTPNNEVEKAINRINYFAWYCEEEYDILKARVKRLPPFLQIPVERIVPYSNYPKKTNRIILGNSRSPENNHIDIVDLLQTVEFKGKVIVPFSYGNNILYNDRLKKYILSLSINIHLLEGFIRYDEYVMEISRCCAAIYNSFRQMALGNIFISLANGTKVYLSEKNPSYKWLKKLGFHIFSIEKHLKEDLINNNLGLSMGEIHQNYNTYLVVTDPKHTNLFLTSLSTLINSKIV